MAHLEPVIAQFEAYNARDIDRFVACYTDDVVVEDATGNILMRGKDAMRAEYAPFFAGFPQLRAEIVQRIEIGDYVIDEERIQGWQEHPVQAAAIYHVNGGRIDHVRLFEG